MLEEELVMDDMDRPSDTILLQTSSDIKLPSFGNSKQFGQHIEKVN